jgi:hypothetical protein
VYGIEGSQFGVTRTRGLVYRNGAYDFEELRSCPDNLKIPGQNGGMVPKVDNLFIRSLEKSDRGKFNIIGCAAKPTKQSGKSYKLVVLDIENRDLKEELRRLRTRKNYRYDGPLVCTLSEYRQKFGEGDIGDLENLLMKTMFAKDRPATEISLKKGGAAQQPTIVHLLQQLLIGQQLNRNGIDLVLREVRAIE